MYEDIYLPFSISARLIAVGSVARPGVQPLSNLLPRACWPGDCTYLRNSSHVLAGLASEDFYFAAGIIQDVRGTSVLETYEWDAVSAQRPCPRPANRVLCQGSAPPGRVPRLGPPGMALLGWALLSLLSLPGMPAGLQVRRLKPGSQALCSIWVPGRMVSDESVA